MPEENTTVNIKKLDNSEIEITTEIEAGKFESYYKTALRKIGESTEIPGFRKGHIPDDILLKNIGDTTLLYEMAEHAIQDTYPTLLEKNNIQAIGNPEITITKIARKNPLGFKAKTAVMPDIELGDYHEISAKLREKHGKENSPEVTSEEIESVVNNVREEWAKNNKDNNDKKLEILGPDGQPIQRESTADSQGSSTNGQQSTVNSQQSSVPELTDEFVKKLGAFESVEKFRETIRENVGQEKKMRAKEKHRMELIEKIIEKSTLAPPEVLITGELDRMMAEFKGNIAGMGLKPEDYFQKLEKTEDEIKKEWRGDALKRVKSHLIIHEIARKEHLSVDERELDEQVSQFLTAHKDANKDRVKNYLAGLLATEKVFHFLEKDGGNSPVAQ